MQTHVSVDQRHELPRWLWLWFPPMVLVAHVVFRMIGTYEWEQVMSSEFGAVENGTFLALVIAVVLGAMTFAGRRHVRGRLFGWWVLALTLACFYFSAEEVSWGYHWGLRPFGEELSRQLEDFNDQGETNLHNMPGILGGMLDNLPRFGLSMAALIGGVLVPLWGKYRRKVTWPNAWIWPTMVCLPTCLIASVITLPARVFKYFGYDVLQSEMGMGETKEYLLALFLMLYLASLLVRLRAGKLDATA